MGLACEEGFNKIRERLATVTESERKVVAVFKFQIMQEGEVIKTMILDLVNLQLYEGDDDAECTIKLDDQLLADILEKRVEALDALRENLIEIEGNVELLAVLKDQIAFLK